MHLMLYWFGRPNACQWPAPERTGLLQEIRLNRNSGVNPLGFASIGSVQVIWLEIADKFRRLAQDLLLVCTKQTSPLD